MAIPAEFGYYQIEFRGDGDDSYPALTDLAYFLNDLNLLYEFSRVIVDPKYRDYQFTRFFAYRNRHRVDPADQLVVGHLSKESPLLLVAVVAATAAAAPTVWVVVQIVEKIVNFRLNREILKLNRDKLKKELLEPRREPQQQLVDVSEATDDAFREQIHIREAEYTYERIERHLAENPVRIREIEVTFTRELPARGNKKQ